MASSYNLYSMDGCRRTETIRLIMAAGGVSYEDKRISLLDWPAFEPSLAGKTSRHQAQVDAVVYMLTEVREAAVATFYAEYEDKKDRMTTHLQTKVGQIFGLIEKNVQRFEGWQSFIVGDSLTWADLHFFTVCETMKKMLADVLEPYPGLLGLEKRVSALPRVSAYLKNRGPDADMSSPILP